MTFFFYDEVQTHEVGPNSPPQLHALPIPYQLMGNNSWQSCLYIVDFIIISMLEGP